MLEMSCSQNVKLHFLKVVNCCLRMNDNLRRKTKLRYFLYNLGIGVLFLLNNYACGIPRLELSSILVTYSLHPLTPCNEYIIRFAVLQIYLQWFYHCVSHYGQYSFQHDVALSFCLAWLPHMIIIHLALISTTCNCNFSGYAMTITTLVSLVL